MSTTQSLYPKAKDCGCVKFVGGRKKRRTRRKYKKRKTHKRRRTRRHHKKRKTRRTRKRGGMRGVQLFGGYKENMIAAMLGGGNRPILAVSDYPPGFKKFTNRDKRQWNKMKAQHKKMHRKK